jgi:hypothetical protein
MTELSIATSDRDLSVIVRVLAGLRLTGRLRVVQDAWAGEIGFDQGRVVSAAFGPERGLLALEAILLALADGRCAFDEGASTPSGDLSLAGAALDAELDRVARRQPLLVCTVPILTAVPGARERNDQWCSSELLALPRSVLTTLAAIDGRRPVHAVCDRRGLVQTLEDLATLRALGLIDFGRPARRYHAFTQLRGSLALARTLSTKTPVMARLLSRPLSLLRRGERIWLGASRPGLRILQVSAPNGQNLPVAAAPAATREVLGPPRAAGQAADSGPGTAAYVSLPPVVRRTRLLLSGGSTSAQLRAATLHGGSGRLESTALYEPTPAVDKSQWWLGVAAVILLLALGICVTNWPLVETVAGRMLGAPVEAAKRLAPDPRGLPLGSPRQSVRAPADGRTMTPASANAGYVLRPVLDARFDSGAGNWPSNPESTAWAADGAYRVLVRESGRFVAIGAPLDTPLQNVVVSATFRKLGGPPGGSYGLIVRDQGPSPRDGINQAGTFYALVINDQGQFGVARRENDHWVEVVPWTQSDSIDPRQPTHELVALAIGSRLGLTVDNKLVANVEVQAGEAGTVGIYVGGDSTDVSIDDFRVEVPPD